MGKARYLTAPVSFVNWCNFIKVHSSQLDKDSSQLKCPCAPEPHNQPDPNHQSPRHDPVARPFKDQKEFRSAESAFACALYIFQTFDTRDRAMTSCRGRGLLRCARAPPRRCLCAGHPSGRRRPKRALTIPLRLRLHHAPRRCAYPHLRVHPLLGSCAEMATNSWSSGASMGSYYHPDGANGAATYTNRSRYSAVRMRNLMQCCHDACPCLFSANV